MTPRTALLTWTAPEVSPTGYLLSFNTPGGQTQVPQALLLRPAPSLGFSPERLPLLLGVGTTSLSPDHLSSVLQEILLPGGVTSHQLRGLFPSTPYSTWLRAMWGDSFTPPVSTSFTTGTRALGPETRG